MHGQLQPSVVLSEDKHHTTLNYYSACVTNGLWTVLYEWSSRSVGSQEEEEVHCVPEEMSQVVQAKLGRETSIPNVSCAVRRERNTLYLHYTNVYVTNSQGCRFIYTLLTCRRNVHHFPLLTCTVIWLVNLELCDEREIPKSTCLGSENGGCSMALSIVPGSVY